jgi:GT2 family glycosyltransferase
VTGHGSPPASQVEGNRWSDIDVADIGSGFATRTVTVVIPCFNGQAELERTLAALAEQTYPMELLDVVVVDDGSEPPIDIPKRIGDLAVALQRQEGLGYGLTRARNRGASTASGEILIFLDCDMIPDATWAEAHARWHHAVSDAVVVGFRHHADFEHTSPPQVAQAVRAGDVEALLTGQAIERPDWIEAFLIKTDNLENSNSSQWQVMSGGNLSIGADLNRMAGGFDESFDHWGGEDNEYGFRVILAGAVVVPERGAHCWHQGVGHQPTPSEVVLQDLYRPKLKHMIADIDYRRPQPGRTYAVPYVGLSVQQDDKTDAATARTVESILASNFYDLQITVHTSEEAQQNGWIARRFGPDHRVLVKPSPDQTTARTPLQITVPAGALFAAATLDTIVDTVSTKGVGILHLTIPTQRPTPGSVIVARLTRAVSRAARLTSEAVDENQWIARLYGERWDSGTSVGVGYVDGFGSVTQPSAEAEPDSVSSTKEPAVSLVRFEKTEATLARIQSRRSLRLADAVGATVRSRSMNGFRAALHDLFDVFLPQR